MGGVGGVSEVDEVGGVSGVDEMSGVSGVGGMGWWRDGSRIRIRGRAMYILVQVSMHITCTRA